MSFQKRKNVPERISKFWLPVTGIFLSESTYSGIPISRTLGQARTSRYLEPNLVSLGFASLNLYNFTPDFSNPRFLETPDNSNKCWLGWDKLTLDNSNLRKFRHAIGVLNTFSLSADDAHLDNLRKKYQEHFSNHRPEFLGRKVATIYYKLFQLNWGSDIYRPYTTCVMFRFCFLSTVRFVCE